MERKKLKRYFKIVAPSSNAAFEISSIGPVLSPFLSRDKINNFCAEYNNVSSIYRPFLPLQVKFFLYHDNTFFFIIKGPLFSLLLKIIYDLDECVSFHNFDLSLIDVFDIVYLKDLLLLYSVDSTMLFFDIWTVKLKGLFFRLRVLTCLYSIGF